MKINWNEFINHQLHVTMKENYGVVFGSKKEDDPAFYEIVFNNIMFNQRQ